MEALIRALASLPDEGATAGEIAVTYGLDRVRLEQTLEGLTELGALTKYDDRYRPVRGEPIDVALQTLADNEPLIPEWTSL